MNNKHKKIISILLLLVIYLFITKIYIYPNYIKYLEYITSAFLIIIVFIAINIFGFQKDKKTELKKNVLILEITILFAFFAIYYGLGLFLGFLKSSYAHNLSGIINNILPLAIQLISIEILRYVIINYDRESKFNIRITTIILCIFEITIMSLSKDLATLTDLFKVIAQIALPLAATNYTMTYLTQNIGYRATILYRLIIGIYPYIMPIIPDLGDYLRAVSKIGLPMFLFIQSYRIIEDYKIGIEYNFKKINFKKSDIPIIVFLVIVIFLISGNFRFQLLSIGSNSMSPAIEKGDAVLLDKKKITKDLQKNDIIAYLKNNQIIVHRIIEIDKDGTQTIYKIKGDANNSIDNIILTNDDIIGVVKLKIKYIGYPSVFISEKFKK